MVFFSESFPMYGSRACPFMCMAATFVVGGFLHWPFFFLPFNGTSPFEQRCFPLNRAEADGAFPTPPLPT